VNRNGVSAIALGAVSSLALVGAGAAGHSSAAHITKGGVVVVAEAPQSAPDWFFPVLSSSGYASYNTEIIFLMYRPLIYLSPTNQVDYGRSLVSKIAVNPSGTTYTLTLSHKYRWSNGRPISAQDVVFTWDLIKDASTLHNAPWAYGPAGSGGVPTDWSSVIARGSNTVVVTLKHPANPQWFIHNGLSQIYPVPKSVWDKYPNNPIRELNLIKSVANSPTNALYDVVDGPFKFQSMVPDQYWDLVPNPKFGGHKATISKLVFQYETSSASEFVGLRDGTISVGYLPPSMWASRKDLPNDVMSSSYLFGMNYMVPNLSSKAPDHMGQVFSNLYVRQALQMGIDEPAIIKSLYHGAGVVTDGPIPPTPKTTFYDPALSKLPYPFNPARGKKLLESHGWHEVGGVMTKDGQKLEFTLLYASGSNTETSMVELLKSDWAREGIDVNLQSEPISEVLATASQSDANKWQMVYWGGGWTYQLDYYPTGGDLFKTGAGENMGGYNSPTMNRLIEDTYDPGTPAQIQARMDAYQVYAARNLPVLWMPWFPMGYARVSGFNEHAKNVHGTVRYFNPTTDKPLANYWAVSS
jgi:peptide/nickel transport system substrate-binding protein